MRVMPLGVPQGATPGERHATDQACALSGSAVEVNCESIAPRRIPPRTQRPSHLNKVPVQTGAIELTQTGTVKPWPSPCRDPHRWRCWRAKPGASRRAALAVRASISHHARGWGDLAGRCWHAQPPAASPSTNQAGTQPSELGSLIESSRLRWFRSLPPAASEHATASTVPRFQGRA